MIHLLRKYGCAVATGVGLFAAFPAIHWYPLAWVALVPLFYQCRNAPVCAVSIHFGLAGWVFHSLLLQWLIANIFWAGGWAFIGYQLLCVFLSLFWSALGAAWAKSRAVVPLAVQPVVLALLWTGMEWLQANLFTGFGWSALGYSQGPDFILLQCASLGGVSLLSFVLVLFNGFAAFLAAHWRHWWAWGAGAAVVMGGAHGAGALLIDTADYQSRPFRAGLFQSNYSQEMKWDWEYAVDMVQRAEEASRTLAAAAQFDAMFWPEALVMQHFEKTEMLTPMAGLARDTGAHLFAGAVRSDTVSGKEYNSSVLIAPDGTMAGYYDKVHLAPFGEYMPFAGWVPFLRQFVPMDVDRGEEQKLFDIGRRRLGPLICFEVLFAPMAETLRRQGADFLAVVTNLAWFGRSNAIAQELEIARFRAVETRLALVHCANTGVSGVFDPWGRFAPVTGVRGRAGRLFHWEELEHQPILGMTQRLLGTLPVAAPGRRPLAGGAVWFGLAAGLLGAVLILAAALRAHFPPGRASKPVRA